MSIAQGRISLSTLCLAWVLLDQTGQTVTLSGSTSLQSTGCVTSVSMMSGPFNPAANIGLPDTMEQQFPMYDNHYNTYSRLAGPTSHFDGVAFWYRPDNTESVYERDPSGYGQPVHLPTSAMETANVKHRRTRSGCFTCRGRRVKVCYYPSFA